MTVEAHDGHGFATIEQVAHAQHGIVTRGQALATGASATHIARLLRTGRLRCLRRGFYAISGANPDATKAIQAGGLLSGASALKLAGVAVPNDDRRLHIRIPRATRSARIRSSRENDTLLVGFSHPRLGEERNAAIIDPPEPALAFLVANGDPQALGPIVDSMLRLGVIDPLRVAELASTVPQWAHAAFRCASTIPESYAESVVDRRLRSLRVRFRRQVWIDGDRVDVLVGERLVIEVDSQKYHGSRAARTSDNQRDRRLQAKGYLVFRIDYSEVMYAWPEVAAEILRLLRTGDHRGTHPARRASAPGDANPDAVPGDDGIA